MYVCMCLGLSSPLLPSMSMSGQRQTSACCGVVVVVVGRGLIDALAREKHAAGRGTTPTELFFIDFFVPPGMCASSFALVWPRLGYYEDRAGSSEVSMYVKAEEVQAALLPRLHPPWAAGASRIVL